MSGAQPTSKPRECARKCSSSKVASTSTWKNSPTGFTEGSSLFSMSVTPCATTVMSCQHAPTVQPRGTSTSSALRPSAASLSLPVPPAKHRGTQPAVAGVRTKEPNQPPARPGAALKRSASARPGGHASPVNALCHHRSCPRAWSLGLASVRRHHVSQRGPGNLQLSPPRARLDAGESAAEKTHQSRLLPDCHLSFPGPWERMLGAGTHLRLPIPEHRERGHYVGSPNVAEGECRKPGVRCVCPPEPRSSALLVVGNKVDWTVCEESAKLLAQATCPSAIRPPPPLPA